MREMRWLNSYLEAKRGDGGDFVRTEKTLGRIAKIHEFLGALQSDHLATTKYMKTGRLISGARPCYFLFWQFFYVARSLCGVRRQCWKQSMYGRKGMKAAIDSDQREEHAIVALASNRLSVSTGTLCAAFVYKGHVRCFIKTGATYPAARYGHFNCLCLKRKLQALIPRLETSSSQAW